MTLNAQAQIEPGFTHLVWHKLEEQNPDFFRAYYTRYSTSSLPVCSQALAAA